jgi:hypothetical protein
MIFFHGFRLPAIASSSEAGGDEAVKPQFRFSGKMVEEATTDGFLCVLCELCERIIFYKDPFKYGCSLYACVPQRAFLPG